MNRRLAAFVGVVSILLGGGYALTQTTPKPKEDAPVRESVKSYVEAFNKGDIETVLGFWADDAESIDDDGKVQNKTALSESLRAICKPDGGNKLAGTIKNVKLIGGTVALIDGTVELTTAEGTEGNPFEGVMVLNAATKKWQFSRMRDLPGEENTGYAPAYAHLKSLEWLLGEWTSKEGEQTLTMNVKWMRNRGYLIVEQSIKTKESEVLGITMMIGYDPASEQIHSWVFDTQGGRGEADWTREGNTWNIEAVGMTADGLEASSNPAWKFVDENTFEWSSTNRQVDGQPRPDIKLTYRKTPAAK
ncbi:YybH family protein [Zavarzinella formosa]|uniref:YybH family protein n=1 Tax=Zavarzinella formosa TaxID=360055 RepID=UPI0002DB96E5|nr:nuclear transport factor 2 family protein [Zavarzinella formosa]